MVIGLQPGKTELKKGIAFSGLAGERLMEWLRSAGLGGTRDEIFENVYFTSLVKCYIPKKSDYTRAVKKCSGFLREQIDVISPNACITLGREPLTMLFDTGKLLEDMVGRSYKEQELSQTLFPILRENAVIIPFPHPSPLSRWLNDENHKRKLTHAIAALKDVLHEGGD